MILDDQVWFFTIFLQRVFAVVSKIKFPFIFVHNYAYLRYFYEKFMKFRGYSTLPSAVLLWSTFYPVSLRYSMQIRLKGKRSKSGEKLIFHRSKVGTFSSIHHSFSPSIHLFIYPIDFLTLSVYQSIRLSVRPSTRPSIRPSHIHQIHGKSREFLITPPCQ